MATFAAFLLVYVIGGLTFVPICLAAALYLAVLACPVHDPHASDDHDLRDAHPADLPHDLPARAAEPDVAAGYFAVCREYVPGGVNGKPPERTTPAGTVVGVESPSVYQSMYRSIFERNRAQGPSMEGAKNAKAQKKARNVFFVVLRHGHLILFDDSEQVEVRYVISLAHRIVDVYAGGDAIPEGELWIKRNCIRLRRARHAADSEAESRPFYLFSENCSEKEDFYFALLRNQERQTGMPISPPLQFEQPHVVKLVQQLHASEENLQTRWINALAGRLFLALYKTPNVEEFIRLKITKKIARVAKPAFIQSINIQRIVMGDSAPMITNPKLRELTLDGDLTAEADIKYNGSFRLEIAAVARIDLGSRFKARHVNMVLAGILKKLDGRILIRVKPPPSNRLWLTFEHPPKMDMTIEPIVSSRQITYGMILRTIENRIREVVAETLVLPNWDDMPFFDTLAQPLRGGIWEDADKAPVTHDVAHEPPLDDSVVEDGSKQHEEPSISQFVRKDEKTMSMPNLGDADTPSLKSRKTARSVVSVSAASDSASASGVEVRASPVKPKSMRSGSFASIARPVVAPDTAIVEAQKSPQKHSHDAIAAIKDISSRSLPTSPAESPVGSPAAPPGPLTEASAQQESKQTPGNKDAEAEVPEGKRERGPSFGKTEDDVSSITDLFGEVVHSHTEPISRPEPAAFSANSEQSSLYSQATDSSTAHSDLSAKSFLSSRKTSLSEKRQMLNMSLNSATTAAKKWFASRQQHSGGPGSATTPGHASPSFPPSSTPVSGSETPARPSSPSRDQQQPQSLWSQSIHSESTLQQPNHDRTPTTPLSSLSSAAKPPTPAASPPKPQPQAENGPSRSSSISVPMGRGQPLPPPGVPLPPPAKPESKWVQGSAQLLGLAKRKSVPPPQSASSSSTVLPLVGGQGGNGNGGDNHSVSAVADIQVPAATAAPAGMHGKDAEHHQQSSLARTRTTSSSGPAGGGKERKGSEGGSLDGNNDNNHSRLEEMEEKEEKDAKKDDSPSSPQSTSRPPSPPSSSMSPPPPPLPPRKPTPVTDGAGKNTGSTSANNGGRGNNRASKRGRNHRVHSDGAGDDGPQFLVIAAPAVGSDASAPATPEAVDERGKAKRFGGGQENGGKEEEDREDEDGEDEEDGMAGSVFSLEMDEGAARPELSRTPTVAATPPASEDKGGRDVATIPSLLPSATAAAATTTLPPPSSSTSLVLSPNLPASPANAATPERSPNRSSSSASTGRRSQGSGWFGGPKVSGGEPRHSGSVSRKAVPRNDGNGDG